MHPCSIRECLSGEKVLKRHVLFTLWGNLHFIFVLQCKKGKENFQTKTGMVECFVVVVESGTIKYR